LGGRNLGFTFFTDGAACARRSTRSSARVGGKRRYKSNEERKQKWQARRYVTPQIDELLTPENSAFIVIDYQPIQVSSIRSMDRDELVFNIVSTAKAAMNYKLPVVHSTVNVKTGRNKPPIQPLAEVLSGFAAVNCHASLQRRADKPFASCSRVAMNYLLFEKTGS
jgi:hypothetical protein